MPRVGDKGYRCVLVHREQRPMIHILEYQVQAVDEANNEITYSYGPQVVITPIRGAKIVAESVSAAWELYTKEAVADLQIGHHLEEEAEAYQKDLETRALLLDLTQVAALIPIT